MNIAKILRTAFFIKYRGGCFWSLPLPFEIIIKKIFQLFSFPQSILASELEKQPFTDVFQKRYSEKFSQISQETPLLESLLNIAAAQKAYNFTKKKNPTQAISCKHCIILENAFFKGHLWRLFRDSIQN